jgi:hypothetical protein
MGCYSDSFLQPLLCSTRINNSVMQPISRQWIGKHIPVTPNTHRTIELLLETVFSTCSVHSGYKEDNWGGPVSFQLSVGSQPVKRGLGGWCEMAASLGVSCYLTWVLHWRLWWSNLRAWSWRIFSLRSHCQGSAGEDKAGFKKLSGCCGDLWIVEISGSAVTTYGSEWCV